MADLDIISVIRSVLREANGNITCAYLFGSHARGTPRQSSDVDIGVLFRQEPSPSLDGLGLDLADALETAAGKSVDLVVLNRAPPDLIHRILRDGVLLIENDREGRVQFEVRARSAYFDVLPYLQEYRRRNRSGHDRP